MGFHGFHAFNDERKNVYDEISRDGTHGVGTSNHFLHMNIMKGSGLMRINEDWG